MATHPNVLLTLDQQLTYSTHIHNISIQAHKPLQMIKTLTAIGWGKQKETLMATYKAVMRPAPEYASSIWSLLASSTSINKLQFMQNAALRTAIGCTQDTNIHLHDETLILPIHEHLQLHSSQYKHKILLPHPLHKHTTYFNTPWLKPTIFNNSRYTTKISPYPHTVTTTDIKTNMRHIHTAIVSRHISTRGNNKILRAPLNHIHHHYSPSVTLTHTTHIILKLHDTNYRKIQCTQNEALRIATGCHQMHSIDHLHTEAEMLKVREHSELLSAQYLARCREPGNVCHPITTRDTPDRQMEETLYTRHRNTVGPMMVKMIGKLHSKHSILMQSIRLLKVTRGMWC